MTASDIAPGRVWLGLSGIRYRVVSAGRERVQLSAIDPDLRACLDARPEELRKHFTLELDASDAYESEAA